MTPEKALQQLNQKMHDACRCGLKKTAMNPVFGKGSAQARVMFIGEAPGKKEDETGEPFVGAAGKMLSQLLASIDLTREEVYITNIVKYRPPENRDPAPQEVQDCWLWLSAQIDLIKPDFIVPLGRHALERFVSGQKISQAHGKVFDVDVDDIPAVKCLAMYHPAAALYNGSLRQILFEDFVIIKRELDAIDAA